MNYENFKTKIHNLLPEEVASKIPAWVNSAIEEAWETVQNEKVLIDGRPINLSDEMEVEKYAMMILGQGLSTLQILKKSINENFPNDNVKITYRGDQVT